MQRDVARAQAATLDEWASIWARDSFAAPGGAEGEVSFLLRRGAKQIRRAIGEDEPESVTIDPLAFGDGEALREPTLAVDARADDELEDVAAENRS